MENAWCHLTRGSDGIWHSLGPWELCGDEPLSASNSMRHAGVSRDPRLSKHEGVQVQPPAPTFKGYRGSLETMKSLAGDAQCH